ncbi:hypothetical protein TRICI_005053 [Trichomonascus ciferrii]|uniref:C2H2-type domain-containing protein n=1 Tax=Trichomonascus ciferrii TaxID=44093 RepID=A0A642UWQ2_9ASCO|nr:hypothetical protein TRICI_005053 [Trichomonascus ciferrii]
MSSSTSSRVEGAVEQQHPDVDSNIDDSLAGVGEDAHAKDDGDNKAPPEDPAAAAAGAAAAAAPDPEKDDDEDEDDAGAGGGKTHAGGPFGASAQRRPSIANLISASTAVADQERLAAAAAAGGARGGPRPGAAYPYPPYPYYQHPYPAAQQQQHQGGPGGAGDRKPDDPPHGDQYPAAYPYLGGGHRGQGQGAQGQGGPGQQQYYYPPPYDAYPLYDPATSAPPPGAQPHQQPQAPHGYEPEGEKGGKQQQPATKKRKTSSSEGVAVASAERPYPCTVDGCPWSFARLSDKRRHMRSHEKPMFHCPYWHSDPTCHRNGGAFNRLDVLKRHLRLVHFVQFKQSDSGWCRVCQKMFPSPKHFVDHCEKCAQDAQPTEWKIDTGAGTIQTGGAKGTAFTITQQNQPPEEPTLLSMSNVDSELKEKQDEQHEAERRRSNDRLTRNTRGSNRQTLSQSIQAGHHPAAAK